MKRSQPRRDWTDARAKVEREAVCRAAGEGCGTTRGCDCEDECAWACWGPLQAAHVVGREHDYPYIEKHKTLYVDPDRIVPLCMNHHARYDPHTRGTREQLDLLPHLTADEKRQALEDLDWDVFAFLHRTTGQRFGPLEGGEGL